MVRIGAKFALLFGCYLLFAGQPGTDELVAALCCAAAAAALSFTVTSIAERHFRFAGVPWVRLAGRTLMALLTGTVLVGARLLRPRPGSGVLQRWPLATGGDDPRTAARRALVTLANSLTPNSYIVAVLGGRGEMLVHRLAPSEPPQDPEWPV
jgi:hypothetical protein